MIDESARELAVMVARVADAEHASDVLILGVGDVLGVTEYFVVASASNRRLVNAVIAASTNTIAGTSAAGRLWRTETSAQANKCSSVAKRTKRTRRLMVD